jgi:hypothetical protein
MKKKLLFVSWATIPDHKIGYVTIDMAKIQLFPYPPEKTGL